MFCLNILFSLVLCTKWVALSCMRETGHSQTSGSAARTTMDGKDRSQSSEEKVSETRADASPDEVELKRKPGGRSKGKWLDRAPKMKEVDILLEEEVSRNKKLKKRNKEIQERLQQVVKLYTYLIEKKIIVFKNPQEDKL